MEEFEITEIKENASGMRPAVYIRYNGANYCLWHDMNAGYYELCKNNTVIAGSNYYLGNMKYNTAFFKSNLFKEQFITQVMMKDRLKEYDFGIVFYRKDDQYWNGQKFGRMRHTKNWVEYRSGKYWYLTLDENGAPVSKKSFSTLAQLSSFLSGTKGKSSDKSSGSDSLAKAIIGLTATGGLLLAKEIYDRTKKED